MNVLLEISFVKMSEISCFTGAGEVENGKKPDDFIPSSWKPYGQCGVKSPFCFGVCYLIWVDPPKTTQLMLITYQPELQMKSYKKERKNRTKSKQILICVYILRGLLLQSR